MLFDPAVIKTTPTIPDTKCLILLIIPIFIIISQIYEHPTECQNVFNKATLRMNATN